MESLHDTHVKLLDFDFLSLTSSSSHPNAVCRKGTLLLSRAETLGVVTSREHKPDRFLKFTIDDGTGCIPCVLWLNQLTSPYLSRRSPPGVRLIAEAARNFATLIQIGVSARVRGKVTVYRGNVQLTVSDVFIERDPNAEILHWLESIRLGRKCYGSLPVNANASS
ncbi:hypothetical protein L1987_13181 [Smallanthus sonchifolius]|uniref:Uncharacterized protein n=1 Tax=Smallanthus sonchifolius TaxID=185202 RepID=A0ACB9JG76_9ASTR|nr:hypothetical protein L1987_13181 [Smallanthus sonchifolius]